MSDMFLPVSIHLSVHLTALNIDLDSRWRLYMYTLRNAVSLAASVTSPTGQLSFMWTFCLTRLLLLTL